MLAVTNGHDLEPFSSQRSQSNCQDPLSCVHWLKNQEENIYIVNSGHSARASEWKEGPWLVSPESDKLSTR